MATENPNNTSNIGGDANDQQFVAVDAEGNQIVCTTTSLSEGMIVIGQPVDGVTQVIEAQVGQSYQFDFKSESITSVERSQGDLIVKFDNGSSVILENYARVENFDISKTLTLNNGEIVAFESDAETLGDNASKTLGEPEIVATQDGLNSSEDEYTESLIEEIEDEQDAQGEVSADDEEGEQQAESGESAQTETQGEDVAQIEPAAGANEIAQRLAQVEPAAGDDGGAGAEGRGYGFNSSFSAQGVIPIDDVGPINPTALQYGISFDNDEVRPDDELAEVDELTPIDPEVEFNDQQVLEDGSILISIDATPVTDDGVLTFSISGIPSTWGVNANGGAYDVTTGTWTFTTLAGTPFTGGPILSPPADSDDDLPNLQVTVTETSAATGRSGNTSGEIDVIVDAVADTPDIDANNVSGNEGDTLAFDIPTALTGEEVNNGLGADDGSEEITSIVLSPVGFDINDFTISNAGGVLTPDASGNIVLGGRADLAGLTITPKDPNFVGTIQFGAEINTYDDPSDADFITTNNVGWDGTEFVMTWKPEANPPEVKVNGGIDDAQVYEDGTVLVDIKGTLDPTASGNEILSVTVSGIDLTKLDAFDILNDDAAGVTWSRDAGTPDNNASFTIVMPAGTNLDGTIVFTPTAESDVDLTNMVATASAYEPATATTANAVPDTFNVIVDAVADQADIEANGDSGNEGVTLDVTVTKALTGEEDNAGGQGLGDGSEGVVNIVISSATDLSQFDIVNANGPVTLDSNGNIVFADRADLAGLQFTPKDSQYSGTVALDITLNTTELNPTVTDTDFDGTNDTSSDTDTVTLVWTPEIDPPSIKLNLNQGDAMVKEDNSVDVPVQVNFAPGASANEYLTITVSGIDLTKLQGGEAGFTATGWTRTDGGDNTATNATYEITLAPGVSYDGIFGFDPLDQSDLDLTGITVTATSTDPSVSPAISASASDSFDVIVDAVADDPSVDGKDNSGVEGSSLSVDIDGALGVDTDGSESIEGYQVRGDAAEMANFTYTVNGVPRTFTVDGTDGVIALSPAEIDALVVTPNDPNYSGTLDLTAVILTADNPNDGEFDTTDNTNTDSDPFTLKWTPEIDPPSIKVNNGLDSAVVLEDNSVNVSVEAALAPGAAPSEYLTLTVTGVDLSVLEGGEAGFTAAGWTRTDGGGTFATDASYTITLAPNTPYSGVFVFDPADDSDLDLSTMTVSATATDPSVSPAISASASDSFNVIVDTVADPVDVQASGDSGEEGETLDITITNLLTGEEINNGVGNDDGSEEFVNVTLSPVDPTVNLNDYVISNGTTTFTAVGNVITFTNPADVTGLTITPKDASFDGSIQLNVTLNTQDVAGDAEITPALDNNTASDTDVITLTWNDDDEPMITPPDAVKVDETDFGAPVLGQDSVNGQIEVAFGDDTAGATIAGNNTYNLGGATSNGLAITVDFDATTNTYVGTTTAGAVFTLVINDPAFAQDGDATSSYTFTLLDTIDHPNTADHNDSLPFTFGFTATDSDNDSADGTITVNVFDDGLTANDDFNSFDAGASLTTDGNVITGLNGGPGAADDLSEDDVDLSAPVQNYVAEVDGTAIATTGTTTINGTYGVLEIAADGSYTYTLNGDPSDMAQISFDEEANDFPSLAERQALNDTHPQLGVADGALDAESIVSGDVTFVSEGAGYNNSFGYYTIAADGTLKATTIAVENANAIGDVNLADLNAGAGESFGFFIIADGFDTNNAYNGIDLSTGSLEFVYGYGTAGARAANIADDGGDVSLVFTSAGGIETVLQGAVYHTTERGSTNNLNADDSVRVVSGLADGDENTLRIGFEDLPGLGDEDFNDFIFDLQLTSNCLVEEFEYTLVDGDGDSSTAILEICADVPEDDKPKDLRVQTLKVDETDFNIPTLDQDSASGTATADFGNDGPGTYEVTNAASVSFSGAKDGTLTSNGTAIAVAVVGNSYVGTAGGETIFTLTLNESTGDYTFTLLGQMDHADASNPDDVIELSFGVVAKDADGDTLDGAITVKVYDDGPVANDDFNTYHGGDATGNVVTGLNGGAGAADDLSQDATNTVTKISFGGTDVNVPQDGSFAVIDGDFGQLQIDMNGDYTFTPKDVTTTVFETMTLIDPATGTVIEVSAVETPTGVEFTATLKAGTADMAAFYLDINGDGGPITSIGGNANSMNPTDGYDYAFEIGTTGGNDTDTTVATVTVDGITLSDLAGADIGIRAHSVGDNREDSLKLKGDVTLTTETTKACGEDVFTYELTDADGDVDTATLTLECEADGKPSIGNAYEIVDETDLGPVVVDGHVDYDFGSDGAGAFGAGNPANITFSGAKDGTLTSNGVAVVIALVGNSYVATASAETIFTLDLQPNGDYTFTLNGVLDHADTTNPDDAITLNFEAVVSDSDGDAATGNITVLVKDDGPVAYDDFASYDKALGKAEGNVITGENGGAGAADDLSQDVENTVTKIAFGTNEVTVPDGGFASVDGNNGTLKIYSDGSYEYTATSGSAGTLPGERLILAPVQSDTFGQQESFTKNGITVSIANTGDYDITWVDTADGSGLGIDKLNSSDSTKMWPGGEAFDISFGGEAAEAVTLVISELGDNNDNGDKGCELTLTLADGSTAFVEVQFDPAKIVDGHMYISLDSTDYGQLITAVNLTSLNSGQYGAASMLLNNVKADFPGEPCGCAEDQFTYTLTDADGDSSTAILDVSCYTSVLLVGQNVDDTDGSTVPFLVGDGKGDIVGGEGDDILIGDAGGSHQTPQTQNYNVLFVLDESGSMGDISNPDSRIAKLVGAVENLLNDFNTYQSGGVLVHFSAFSTYAGAEATFNVSNAQGLSDAIAFLQGLDGSGTTNYEAGLQSGIEWLESGEAQSDASTITYFISDGAPNRYLDGVQLATIQSDQQYYDEVTGVDGTDEIGTIQALSDEVIAVGIDINGTNNEAKLDIIASGDAILIDSGDDLDNVLQETSPVTRLDSVGGDVIEGGDRNDLIFGDVVNTDTLADDQGLSTKDGAGWEVFERLENGEGSDAAWDRADTTQYIRDHAEELAAESVNSQGGRSGGDDTLYGGAGNDTIFGQEGDDLIAGGAGDDVLYGGSGSDTFLFESVADGHDTIKDFAVGEDVLDVSGMIAGYGSLQDAINDFVFDVQSSGGNTTISVDANGSTDGSQFVELVTLEGVSLNINDLDDITSDSSSTV